MITRSLFSAALAAALLTSATPASAQEMKIGIVDMKRVFRNISKPRTPRKR